jgi:ribosomal protein S6
MQEIENKDLDSKSDESSDFQVYEVGYLLVSTLSEEEIPGIYGNLKELFSSLGAKPISDEMPLFINLAYPMVKVISNKRNKFDTAYFGWSKFYLEPEKAKDLKKKLDAEMSILRFLIIKTVKENTIASKRFNSKDGLRKRIVRNVREEEKIENPIDSVAIDKEIEAMVVE